MRRRKNGEGSYGTKTIKGVKYQYYTSPNQEWTVYAKTATELKQKKEQREKEIKNAERSVVRKELLTVNNLCQQWLQSRKNDISQGTYDNYEDLISSMITKFKGYDIGNKQIHGLNEKMLESYLFALATQYSKNSIDRVWTIIKQSIEYGQANNLMPNTLNIKMVHRPKERNVAVKKKEVQFTTLEDMEILYNEAYRTDDLGRPIYGGAARILVFIMYSGVRISEAIGLKWRYVKNDLKKVTIRQTHRKVAVRDENGVALIEDGHKVYEKIQKDPKTKSGERTIPLPKRAIQVLQYFTELFPDHKPDDNVFLTANGTVFNKENVERTLKTMLKNSNCSCKSYTPHSLRHGYGSILLSEGVDIKTISILLGHKDVSTTYNIYIHVLESDIEKSVRNVFDKEV